MVDVLRWKRVILLWIERWTGHLNVSPAERETMAVMVLDRGKRDYHDAVERAFRLAPWKVTR